MSDNITQITIALLTFLGLVIPAYFVFRNQVMKAKKETEEAKKETEKVKKEKDDLIKKHLSSSFEVDLSQLNEVRNIIHDIIIKNPIDRVLMLSSVNGKDPVNWISVIWEQHSNTDVTNLSIGATSKYMDISSDDEYKKMLHQIEKVEPYRSDVPNMRDCMLKDIYMDEGVKYSLVVFGYRKNIDSENDQLIYFSWATHDDMKFSRALELELTSTTNRIVKILQK